LNFVGNVETQVWTCKHAELQQVHNSEWQQNNAIITAASKC